MKLETRCVLLYCFIVTCAFDAYAAQNVIGLSKEIKGNKDINCHWVDDVGVTSKSAKIRFIDTDIQCSIKGNESENNFNATGICRGTIRCTGIGKDWGEVYFEDVHCPGIMKSGKIHCGRQEVGSEGNINYVKSVKSCLGKYLHGSDISTERRNESKVIKDRGVIRSVVQ